MTDSVAIRTLLLHLIAALVFGPGLSIAQSPSELDRLIFEPVALTPDLRPATSSTPISSSKPHAASPAAPSSGNSLTARTPEETGSQQLILEDLSPRELSSAIADHKDAIDTHILEDGPYASSLFEDLLALGQLYQHQNDHEQAIAAFERAEFIIRINEGLFSLEQTESIEAMIDSLLAVGDLRQTDQKREYLTYLYERRYGREDLRTVPEFISLADWNLNAFHQRIRSRPPAPRLQFSIGGGARPQNPQRMQAFSNLFRAQVAYVKAIRALIINRAIDHPQLIELERRLVETFFLQAHGRKIMEDPDNYLNQAIRIGSRIRDPLSGNFSAILRKGNEAYERILIYLNARSQTSPREIAAVMLEQGDWQTLLGRKTSGMRKYQAARDFLVSRQVPDDSIQALLAPAVPTLLPTFTRTEHSRKSFGITDDEVLDYQGYIDVAFNLNRHGRARNVDVLGKSETATQNIERRLLRVLSRAQFRPRLPEADTSISLRYYFTSKASKG
ncbi:MAG: tetratricopeptide repeat protein [Pseudomonadales bacterium]|nr:tetratricopeptide repeat protein [Pseudomonadales bacterium]